MALFLVALLLAAQRLPFDASWASVVLFWDYARNPVICHDENAKLVGDDKRKIQVGADAKGNPVTSEFRFLTYRCDVDKHEIRIWVTIAPVMVREVSCHFSKIGENKGYDKDEGGHVIRCKDKHRIVLKGSAKE